ncbi:MAG TPA: alpha/beta fold hydrolase [Pyrinomonadaceae bacterium]
MPFVTVDELKLAYDDIGSGSPVILIHGFPFNRSLWNDQVAELSKSHRIIIPDLRGFGESDSSPGAATMTRLAQDVAVLMDALNLPQAIFGGLSMGGYVVLAFCKQFPSRVRALILADTRAQGDTEEGKQGRAQQAERTLSEGMAPIADSMLPKLLTPETVAKHPEVVKRVRDMMMKTKPEGAAAALLGMAAREDQTGLLSKIDVPTLILVGKNDAITPASDSETMHAKIAGSKLVIIEGAGHVSNIEQAEKFNREVKEFLSSL